jgi:hypothetical protein
LPLSSVPPLFGPQNSEELQLPRRTVHHRQVGLKLSLDGQAGGRLANPSHVRDTVHAQWRVAIRIRMNCSGDRDRFRSRSIPPERGGLPQLPFSSARCKQAIPTRYLQRCLAHIGGNPMVFFLIEFASFQFSSSTPAERISSRADVWPAIGSHPLIVADTGHLQTG